MGAEVTFSSEINTKQLDSLFHSELFRVTGGGAVTATIKLCQ
jgi:hypothetical protein